MKMSNELKEAILLANIKYFARRIKDVNDREEINSVCGDMVARLLRKRYFGVDMIETLDFDIECFLVDDEEKVLYEAYMSCFDISISLEATA